MAMLCGMKKVNHLQDFEDATAVNLRAEVSARVQGMGVSEDDHEATCTAVLWAALELQVGGPDKLARLINQTSHEAQQASTAPSCAGQ